MADGRRTIMNLFGAQVLVCGGTGCAMEGAMDIANIYKE